MGKGRGERLTGFRRSLIASGSRRVESCVAADSIDCDGITFNQHSHSLLSGNPLELLEEIR